MKKFMKKEKELIKWNGKYSLVHTPHDKSGLYLPTPVLNARCRSGSKVSIFYCRSTFVVTIKK